MLVAWQVRLVERRLRAMLDRTEKGMPGTPGLPPNTILAGGRLYTRNSVPGWRLRGQPVIESGGEEFRSWSPYTSKIAAFILEGGSVDAMGSASSILYLGASYGTTVSHLADMLPHATITSIEIARRPYIGLQAVARNHPGVIPVLEDAAHPERYTAIAGSPQVVIEDVAQKNLLDILVRNITCLPTIGSFYLVVKSRSVDSSAPPARVYEVVSRGLHAALDCKVRMTDISRFEKDHAVLAGTVSR